MQTLMIPQSPIVDNRGQVTQEWLVFMNELIRLSNNVISSDVVDKADNTDEIIIEGLKQSSIIVPVDDEMATYVTPVIENDEPISNVSLVASNEELPQDNPYALMAAIKQQQYDQQIWSLTA